MQSYRKKNKFKLNNIKIPHFPSHVTDIQSQRTCAARCKDAR